MAVLVRREWTWVFLEHMLKRVLFSKLRERIHLDAANIGMLPPSMPGGNSSEGWSENCVVDRLPALALHQQLGFHVHNAT